MSGIVAVVRADGAAVPASLVQRLTASLRHRGPHAAATWCDGQIGLGHALLRTTAEAEHERQPFSLDGHTFIVADGRIDARGELIRALGSDRAASEDSPDVELILRAYLRWGERCVDHLLGDFAFVVWDGLRRRLFCARDHMGVKPFYYAQVGRSLVVSSTIEALRLHPDVSGELNDLAIADFLMFGFNQDSSTTGFRDIRRLPPAHTLRWSADGLLIERYWTLPIEDPVYYRNDSDYVDECRSVVRQAVSDRLRVPRVGVFMSGGLDSPMLAATAQHLLRGGGDPNPVHAFTFVYESLFSDPEREQASAVAAHLGIPIRHYAVDQPAGWSNAAEEHLPEPSIALLDRAGRLPCYRDCAGFSPVAFYGEGPDNALGYEWQPHVRQLSRTRRFGRLAADVGKHVVRHRRVPLLPAIPGLLRRRRGPANPWLEFPDWLEPSLVRRLNLEERWRAINAGPRLTHPWRPRGYASLLSPRWQFLFERWEPAQTGVPLEVRHPYVDIRVLRFMLRVPGLPWCRSKYLLRAALRGTLPEPSRRRAKTPLAGDPLREKLNRFGLPQARPSDLSRRYGDESRLKWTDTVWSAYGALQFVALTHWLNAQQRTEQQDHGHTNAASA